MKQEEMEQALEQIYEEIIGDGPTAKYFCERNRVDCPRSSEGEDYSPHSDECVGCPHFKVYWHKEEEALPCPCMVEMCTCPELTGEDIGTFLKQRLALLAQEGKWRLTYKSLEDRVWRLCYIGTCSVCGKQLCIGTVEKADTLDNRLAASFRHLYQIAYNCCGMTFGQLREMFPALFHVADRAVVRSWLSRPENQNIISLYRH